MAFKLLVVLYIVALLDDATATCKLPKCEPVPAEICKTLDDDYSCTLPPDDGHNKVLMKTQFDSFSLIIDNCVSSLALKFFCSYSFPPCTSYHGVLQPCQELCEEVKSECEPIMKANNYDWPPYLNCDNFVSYSSNASCISGTVVTPPTMTPKENDGKVVFEKKCQMLEDTTCALLNANYTTYFPSGLLNQHITMNESAVQFNVYQSLLDSNCSTLIKPFLCATHFPVCVETSPDVELFYPCQHNCIEVQKSCEPFLNAYNHSWPDSFNCDHFPSSSNSSRCLELDVTKEDPPTASPTTSTASPDSPTNTTIPKELPSLKTCTRIIPEAQEICGDIHENYTLTCFPNGKYITQSESYKELSNFIRLINSNCADEMKPFLCYYYFPACSPLIPEIAIKPCRNLCRKAKSGCESCLTKHDQEWQPHLDCDNFPVKKDCVNLKQLGIYFKSLPTTEPTC